MESNGMIPSRISAPGAKYICSRMLERVLSLTNNLQLITILSRRHLRAHALAQHHPLDVPMFVHVEHHDRHAVVHAQRNRRRVHHLQVLVQHFPVRNRGKKFRIRNLLRIGVVNSVHAGSFQNYVRLNFHGPQRRRRIGRKVRIPRARCENYHTVLFEVPHRAPPDERLRDLFHLDRAQHARIHSFFFQRILQCQGVDDRRQHAHVVARRAIDFKTFLPRPAEDISSAHHDRRLHAQLVDFLQLARDGLNRFAVDAESLRSLKGLSGKLQQDSLICWLRFFCSLLIVVCSLDRRHESPGNAAQNPGNCNKLSPPPHSAKRPERKRALGPARSALKDCGWKVCSLLDGRCRNGRRFRSRPGRCAASLFADLEAHETPDGNVFAQFRDRLRDHLADRDALVLDVVLFIEAVLLVELFHFSADDFFNNVLWLAGGQRLCAIDLALLLEHLWRHFLAPHVARIERGHVHRNVVAQLLERFRARDKIRLAVQLDQYANFAARVNVAANESFGRFAHGFLRGRGLPFLSQDGDRFLYVPARFHERGAAVAETSVGPLAQFFHELRRNLRSLLLCTHPFFLFFSFRSFEISCVTPLSAKRPAPSRSGRASPISHPRCLLSVLPRPAEPLFALLRPAAPRLPRSRLLAFRIARKRSYPRTPRLRLALDPPPISDPPPAIAGTRCGLPARNPQSWS